MPPSPALDAVIGGLPKDRVVARHGLPGGRVAERLGHAAERARPIVHAQPGFSGQLILVDHKAHKNISIGLWASDADVRTAYEQEELRRHLPHKHFAAGDVGIEFFEVAHRD